MDSRWISRPAFHLFDVDPNHKQVRWRLYVCLHVSLTRTVSLPLSDMWVTKLEVQISVRPSEETSEHNSEGFFVPVVLCARRGWEKGKLQAATWSSNMTSKSGSKERTPNWPKFLLGLHLLQRKLRHTRTNLRLVFRGWIEKNTAISVNSFRIKKNPNNNNKTQNHSTYQPKTYHPPKNSKKSSRTNSNTTHSVVWD